MKVGKSTFTFTITAIHPADRKPDYSHVVEVIEEAEREGNILRGFMVLDRSYSTRTSETELEDD